MILCSLVGTGELSTTVVNPGGGRYTRQYARSWLSCTILSKRLRSLSSLDWEQEEENRDEYNGCRRWEATDNEAGRQRTETKERRHGAVGLVKRRMRKS